MLVLVAFASYKSFILYHKINPTITKQTYFKNLDEEEPLVPYNYGFDFAFGIKSPLDASIGSYTVNEVYFYYSNETDEDGN
jgi:hypothetical protein